MITIPIDGVIGWDVTGRDIRRQLANAGGAPVRVEISSPGGFVFDGLEIFNRLRSYSGEVHTHIVGLAASMASYITLAGDKITAEDNAVFMIHNVWGMSVGDHREMRAEADILEGLSALLAKAYAEKTGQTVEEARALMDDETFLFGDEILSAGFVDDIIVGDGDGNGDRDGSVATARTALDACLVNMKEYEDRKGDLQQIAALLKVKTATGPQGNSDNKTPLDKGGKFNQEVVVMNLQELKAESPALCAQLIQEGKEIGLAQALDCAKGHAVMAKQTGAVDFALACIIEGKSLTDQEVVAEYLTAGLAKKDIKAADDDTPPGDLANPDDQDTDAVEAKLLDDVMALSTKTGAAVAPGKEV